MAHSFIFKIIHLFSKLGKTESQCLHLNSMIILICKIESEKIDPNKIKKIKIAF